METNNECMERGKTYVCIPCGKGFTENQFSIQCDCCKEWFHGLCVSLHEVEAEELDKFYCNSCHRLDSRLVSVQKPITNNWRHNRTELNPTSKPIQSGTQLFVSKLKDIKFIDAKSDESVVKRMRGQQLTFKELLQNGFNVPILVESKDGLELTVPSNTSFSYRNLLDYYPLDYELDVIDVRRQLNIKMKAKDFINSFEVESELRPNVYNCISLEVSNSGVSNLVRAPNIVHKLSWVDQYWPGVDEKPAVSKYCLISMKNSFTEFHIDFGGTSVWYHVLSGEKVFYIIKPTKQNLEQYEKWMASPTTTDMLFAYIVGVEQCYRLTVSAGHTLLIPTGWIHAVLTTQDSLAFGGNFLHSLNIELQLKIREMEHRIKTPFKFQFPFFELTHWYAAPNVLKLLEDNLKQKPPKHVVTGVTALIPQLRIWQKKSKDLPNQTETDGYLNSTLAPKGFNCFKLIKDLNSVLKKAIRKLEGQPLVKKRGKSYKDFNLPTEEPIGSLQTSPQHSQTDDNIEDELVLNEERDSSLVVDDSIKPANKGLRTQSTDSESKGSLKLTLSISGAKEILGTNQMETNKTDHSLIGSDNSFDSPKKGKNQRKRKSDQQMDDEIESMVRGRPEDDDYIYLDLETAVDEEETNKSKTTTKDESWAPKAKVTIKAHPKAPRVPRDNAKRDVVETSIANAAAKMENMPEPKREYIKKKAKVAKSAVRDQKSSTDSNIDLSVISSVASNSAVDSPLSTGCSSANSETLQSKAPQSQSQTPSSSNQTKKAKKGLKTPKQRLQKIMSQKNQKKRLHF